MKFIGNCSHQINWEKVINSIKNLNTSTDISNPINIEEDKSIKFNEDKAYDILYKNKEKYYQSLLEKTSNEYVDYMKKTTQEMFSSWELAGYKYHQVTWDDYYCLDFPEVKEIVNDFSSIVQMTPVHERIFITRLNPGKVAPWHWDVIPDVREFDHLGNIERFVCFIQSPIPGHTLSFQDITFYNESIGNIYKWNSIKDYHAAANSSLEPYYLFHYSGYL